MPFEVRLNLKGSQQLNYIPLGETTNVKAASKWKSPSFSGSVLPAKREVNKKGFTAEWKVLHLNRNFPQFWTNKAWAVQDSFFAVHLLITADIYQKTTRVAKYAFMFIIFTFAAFFFAEIINKRRVHPIQYMLTGLGVILFYVLLLSLAEHIGFDLAYMISAAAITLLITLYANCVISNRSFTFTIFGILVIVYSYLYMVLQLEDYALLAGSIGLFGILSAVMYITRNIDWYSLNE